MLFQHLYYICYKYTVTCPVCGDFLTTLIQLGVVSNKVKILEELIECKAMNKTLTNVTGENPTAPVH